MQIMSKHDSSQRKEACFTCPIFARNDEKYFFTIWTNAFSFIKLCWRELSTKFTYLMKGMLNYVSFAEILWPQKWQFSSSSFFFYYSRLKKNVSCSIYLTTKTNENFKTHDRYRFLKKMHAFKC